MKRDLTEENSFSFTLILLGKALLEEHQFIKVSIFQYMAFSLKELRIKAAEGYVVLHTYILMS
jgi:hypothetical protein